MNYYIIHAFANEVFHGNPAGVVVVQNELSEEVMQRIAASNKLAETAFLQPLEAGKYGLRWFTPVAEIDLCGHGTLAAAYVVMNFLECSCQRVQFVTMSGTLAVRRQGDWYELVLPMKVPHPLAVSEKIAAAIGAPIVEAYGERDLFIVLENEEAVRRFQPDYDKLAQLNDWLGVVVTAQGRAVDFVSRYFCPELRAEDAVTGSSHCSLAPIWCEKLGKKKLTAQQLSQERGFLSCQVDSDNGHVLLLGQACLYLQGEITVAPCQKEG